ncbi:MAG: transglutaminase family protein [Alphaproteobacteria bacterium]|nr:transglutaminase family protein [Alphaproteobacteria bacterium]
MLYDVRLRIRQVYTPPATAGRYLLRLMPADLPGAQRLVTGILEGEPAPQERWDGRDFFGNAVAEVAYKAAQAELGFSVRARVQRLEAAVPQAPAPLLAALGDEITASLSLAPDSPHHFTGRSVRVAAFAEASDYARAALPADATSLSAVQAIGEAIHRDFRFMPGATTVETPVEQVFTLRAGVCQDFSHFMIACLRGIGVPAGYVSGFLRTIPPTGQTRLEGSDAMHAWVRAWCGQAIGWVEYDPTNAVFARGDHIVVAYGRDYSDAAPTVGAVRSAGTQATSHAVDVVPVEAPAAPRNGG